MDLTHLFVRLTFVLSQKHNFTFKLKETFSFWTFFVDIQYVLVLEKYSTILLSVIVQQDKLHSVV